MLKLTTDKDEASRGRSATATAELLVKKHFQRLSTLKCHLCLIFKICLYDSTQNIRLTALMLIQYCSTVSVLKPQLHIHHFTTEIKLHTK